jgi:hypothetical protein
MRIAGPALCVLLTAAAANARDLSLPDPALTPGQATALTKDEVCAKSWGHDTRHVTAGMKAKVFARYGLTGNADQACKPDKHGRRCEIDHLISRELGGADAIENLWPEPFGTHPWNAVRKDRLENRLNKAVCNGTITLEDAQREIRTDWRIPYARYFGQPR